MFESALYPNEIVIDESNWLQHAPPEDVSIDGELKTRGLVPRDWEVHPLGSFGKEFDLPLIPEIEWPERIEEMERTKSRLSDIAIQAGIDCLDQNGTNYCWGNAPVYCVMLMRAVMGLPSIRLSPASVCAPLNGYRNQGGWGQEALKRIISHGIAPQDIWPANAISRQYDTPETWARASDFKVLEWYDLKPRSFSQLMTCLFLRHPVAKGLNWWSHEITGLDPVLIPASARNRLDKFLREASDSQLLTLCRPDERQLKPAKVRESMRSRSASKYGTRDLNSWGKSYGTNGYFILAESKATPDDACTPLSVNLSA